MVDGIGVPSGSSIHLARRGDPLEMPTTILVTGGSGNVGSAVARGLRQRGFDVRMPTSRTELDFRDPSTFAAAVSGCDALFLMRPPAIADVKRTLLPVIDAARAHGVRQIVFLSVAGADRNSLVPHHAVEQHLMADAGDYTILRPGFFTQNLASAYRDDIVEDDRIYVPAGRARVAFIDARDIAEVAVLALAAPEAHRRSAYTLTGPEAVGFDDAARWLTQTLGRSIRYQPASVLGYIRHLRGRRLPWAQTAVQTILHVGLRFGQAEAVDPTLATLLGRRGRTLRQYIEDYAAEWTKPTAADTR